MPESGQAEGWAPSVYYAESVIRRSIEKVWPILLDYETWNPTFAHAEVVPVRGEHGAEGELVLIRKSLADVRGEPLPEFYAETVKVVPQRHIVWYVYPRDGDAFRNFVDFGLRESPEGTRFNIYYHAQNRLSGDLLLQERKNSQATVSNVALALKEYCEARA